MALTTTGATATTGIPGPDALTATGATAITGIRGPDALTATGVSGRMPDRHHVRQRPGRQRPLHRLPSRSTAR
ncbi:hypothetical protein [Nonomuraea sp. NPDC049695]|uniref:hypothetical protein n=1 Tax=Nonomuraea sp. NPDC049695 TaxID=3154734 RepID=UPI003430C990